MCVYTYLMYTLYLISFISILYIYPFLNNNLKKEKRINIKANCKD